MIEIFAGTGNLTAWIRKVGLTSSFGIDSSRFKDAKAPILTLDLLTPNGRTLLFQFLKNDRVIAAWLAPPCGTSSMARTIQNGGPPPLRDDLHPDGFGNLNPADAARVASANALYSLSAEVIDFCCENGLLVLCENPFTSIFWTTSHFLKCKHLDLLTFQAHTACAYGSKRPKRTMLAANHSCVECICMGCPGNHRHAKWGVQYINGRQVFATKQERHYPSGLCACIAQVILHLCQSHGMVMPADSLQFANKDVKSVLQQAKVETGIYTKLSKLPPLIPEYSKVISAIHWPTDTKYLAFSKTIISARSLEGHSINIPAGARLIQRPLRLTMGETVATKSCKRSKEGHAECKHMWGVPWSPSEFVAEASRLGHPKSFLNSLPDTLMKAVQNNVNNSHSEIAAKRNRWFMKWLKRADELTAMDRDIRAHLQQGSKQVIDKKRISLFKEILESSNYHDMAVVNILLEGAPLSGVVEESGIYPKVFRPASLSVQSLKEKATDIRTSILSNVKSSGDPDCDAFVWEETCKEREKGWLTGPIPVQELADCAIVSRRFGIWQKSKYRCIDDFSASLVNSTCQVGESPLLHAIDVSASLLEKWMRSSNELRGHIPTVLARSFDLKSAYRQIFVKENERELGYIAVFCPEDNKTKIFRTVALPFGSIQSVYAFLRLSSAIWHIGVTHLDLAWSSFFDDFLVYSDEGLARHTEKTVEMLFDLLGWTIAKSGGKALPFSNDLDCLGVNIDLSDFQRGVVRISNTEDPKKEISGNISSHLSSKKMTSTEAQKLRGRMQFAENQIFGRQARRCLKAVSEHLHTGRSFMDYEFCNLLGQFSEFLEKGRPREVRLFTRETWLIFTDASYDADCTNPVGLGCVLVNPCGIPVRFMQETPCEQQLKMLGHGEKGTIIFEAEMFALLLALRKWKSFFSGRQLVAYVDNDAVRCAIASSSGHSGVVAEMIKEINHIEEEVGALLWIARVPTKSNISDDPSRGDSAALTSLGAIRDHP